MKKVLNLLLLLILFFIGEIGFSAQYKVIVIPDNLLLPSVDYVVYTDAAGLISTDVINFINTAEGFYAPSVGYVKKIINNDARIKIITKQALAEFKSTYNIDFEAFKQIGKKFSANYILLITCNIDSQNYMLRRTVWDLLNIPGATVLDPAYRLSTEAFLLDLNAAQICWQSNYQKLISSRENRIIATSFSPVSEQLEKIKNYSSGFLASQIAQETQVHIDDSIIIATRAKTIRPNVLTWDKGKSELKKTGRKASQYSYVVVDATLTGSQKAGRKIKKDTKSGFNKFKAKIKEQRELIKQRYAEQAEIKRLQRELKESVKNNQLQIPKAINPTLESTPVLETKPTLETKPAVTPALESTPVLEAKPAFMPTPETAPLPETISVPRPAVEVTTLKDNQKPLQDIKNFIPAKKFQKTQVKRFNNVKPATAKEVTNSILKKQIENIQNPTIIEIKQTDNIEEIPFAPQKPRLRGETMINDI